MIDAEYKVFTVQTYFAVEGTPYFEVMLNALKDRFVKSVKRHENGKLHVRLKTRQLQ